MVGVDTNDSDRPAAIRLLDHAHAAYPVGIDPIAKVATRYLIEALPVTYFIDSQGRVAGVAFGQLTYPDLHSWLKKLLIGLTGLTGPLQMTTRDDGDESDDREKANLDERAAKFAENAPPIPRKAVVVAVVAFVVLGLGGVVLDHFFGGPVSTTAVTAGTDPPGLSTTLAP